MAVLRCIVFLCALVWSLYQLSVLLAHKTFADLIDSSLTLGELASVLYGCVVVLGLTALIRILFGLRQSHYGVVVRQFINFVTRRETLLVSALSLIPQPTVSTVSSDVAVPARAAFQPGVALALVVRLLKRQREIFAVPDRNVRLSEESSRWIYDLGQKASRAHQSGVQSQVIPMEEVDILLDELIEVEEFQPNAIEEWDLVARLYGDPYIEGRNGIRATFGKKRSVEVLAWLSMNLERPRRSAVRTAVWDVDISDASFSTVMSDIRRGVCSVTSGLDRKQIFPPTFTDSIELGVSLVTDFDLLHRALLDFRNNKCSAHQLASELGRIRDVPFAGANYMWADLDGTTTRMVLLALEASNELAEWAKAQNEVQLCSIAVKAGLRVMPGDEQLLAIQQSFISQRSMSSN